jgi:transposase
MLWGLAAAGFGILPVRQNQIARIPAMNVLFDPRKPATAFDHTTTLVAVLELSGKSWEMGASVPGVSRRPLRKLDVKDISGVTKLVEQWTGEACKAGCAVTRVVLGYEAGRDGFWIAPAGEDRPH